MKHKAGLSKDAGYMVGARRTFSISPADAWDFLFSEEGLQLWLGKIKKLDLDKPYRTSKGITGKVRVFKPLSHIRITWKKTDWSNESTVQVRVIDSKGRATISFHQEKLMNSMQREEMKDYWNKVLDKINEVLEE